MKKFFYALLTLISTTACSQSLRVDKVDDFTGEITRRTEYYTVGTNRAGKLKAAAVRIGDNIYLELFSAADQGCAGAVDNYVSFLFDDGTTYTNDMDVNKITCEDLASSYYVVSREDFTGAITRIRFKQSEGYIDYEVDGDYTIQSLIALVAR